MSIDAKKTLDFLKDTFSDSIADFSKAGYKISFKLVEYKNTDWSLKSKKVSKNSSTIVVEIYPCNMGRSKAIELKSLVYYIVDYKDFSKNINNINKIRTFLSMQKDRIEANKEPRLGLLLIAKNMLHYTKYKNLYLVYGHFYDNLALIIVIVTIIMISIITWKTDLNFAKNYGPHFRIFYVD